MIQNGASDEALKLPPAGHGQRIGLFGGSFNPPHSGHRHVAEVGLKRVGLERVWWLVTPGNPLKEHGELAPLAERLAAAHTVADHPRMTVSAFEAAAGTAFSAETIALVKARRPGVRFVWLMGADNLTILHRWSRWRDILAQIPVAVVDRPGASPAALASPAARAFVAARVPESAARSLPYRTAPAWAFLHAPLNPTSSTSLRSAGR